jgi:hypothetical protein
MFSLFQALVQHIVFLKVFFKMFFVREFSGILFFSLNSLKLTFITVINMGILQFPLYFFGQKKISYGLLGSVVAGGILRGFDSRGLHFGKYGNPSEDSSWWTPNTAKRFHLKKGCFIDQYKSYSVYGVNITVRIDCCVRYLCSWICFELVAR